MLSAFSFDEMRTTLGFLYFQKVIRIRYLEKNVFCIFFLWNADNIFSCPHVVRLSVVVRISSIPQSTHVFRINFTNLERWLQLTLIGFILRALLKPEKGKWMISQFLKFVSLWGLLGMIYTAWIQTS